MKKLFILILSAILLLSLSACGAPQSEDSASPTPPPYLGKWQLRITMEDGSIAQHDLFLGQNGSISYAVTVAYAGSIVDEEDYSFYDWTEINNEITCEGGEYTIVFTYNAENHTLTVKDNPELIFKPAN